MKLKEVKRSFWNPTTRTCLGRTGDSWLKLIAFYIVLYSCLAAIWSLYFYIFRLTINSKYPKWQLNESLIGSNPGVGLRPKGIQTESALIKYKAGDKNTFEQFIKNINDYLSSPIKSASKAAAASDSTDGANAKTRQLKPSCNQSEEDSFCPFDTKSIPVECTSSRDFSFNEGKPCILLKLNRIYGWLPQPYTQQPVGWPTDANFTAGNIQITCEGQHDPDKEHLGPVKYYPETGIETKYYPFLNQPGYQPPYIMVHFTNPRQGVLIYIECKAWAMNVEHDRYNKKGLTTFELFIEKTTAS